MKIWVCLLLFILTVATDSTVSLLESLYDNKQYEELKGSFKRSNLSVEAQAAASRLQGHLCFFGMNNNYYINLACAWRNYTYAAQLGDPEGLFYTGLFLNNLLFDSLEPLKGKFGEDIDLIEKAEDLSTKIKAIKALALTMNFMSSALRFPLALKYFGSILKPAEDKCYSVANYYARAAENLLSYFNTSFQSNYGKKVEIHKAINPYNFEQQRNEIYYLRFLERYMNTINGLHNTEDSMNYIVNAYAEHGEYKLSKKLAEKILAKEDNNTYANYALGMLYLIGETVPTNYTEALHHLLISADANHGDALNLLGYMYLKGLGVSENRNKAADYFKRSFNQGNKYGAYNHASTTFDPKDFALMSSVQMFFTSSMGGIMQGFYNLGMMYAYGIGIPQACRTGVTYLEIALDLMIQRKYFNEAYDTYVRGHDKAAAMQYMVMAEIGNASAQVSVGNLFDDSNQIKDRLWIHQYEPQLNLNKRLALKYYMAAFEQGNDVVCMRLGDFYYYGHEVEKDLNRAMHFYNRSKFVATIPKLAVSLLYNYGLLHQYGIGLPQDYEIANAHYNIVATLDPSWYYPVKVTNTVMAYQWVGIREVLPSLNIYFLLISAAFFAISLYLFLTRI